MQNSHGKCNNYSISVHVNSEIIVIYNNHRIAVGRVHNYTKFYEMGSTYELASLVELSVHSGRRGRVEVWDTIEREHYF